jgi:uncharacterized protein
MAALPSTNMLAPSTNARSSGTERVESGGNEHCDVTAARLDSSRPTRLYKRFATARGYYVYDAFSNQILELSRRSWDLLDSYLGALDQGHTTLSGPVRPDDGDARALSEIDDGLARGYLRPCSVGRMRFYDTPSALERAISTRVSQLTLELTEACTFRCRYCQHTYDTDRYVSPRAMQWSTAYNGLRTFFAHNSEAQRATVSFWGGEPLLQFDLISRIVEFALAHRPTGDLSFSFTTNGSLITPQIAAFLAEHSVHVMVSIDGPRHIHDRYRLHVSGRGTFDYAMDGLHALKEAYGTSFDKHVSVNAVLAPDGDIREAIAFFDADPVFAGLRVGLSVMSTHGMPAGSTSQAARTAHRESLRAMCRDALVSQGAGSKRPLAAYAMRRLLTIAIRPRGALGDAIPPNGCCVPLLKKMLVAVDGTVHLCEQIDRNTPVGNVNAGGVDMPRVLRVASEYCDGSLAACRRCWALRLCSCCFTLRLGEGRAPGDHSGVCDRIRNQMLGSLEDYMHILEIRPDAFDDLRGMTVILPV